MNNSYKIEIEGIKAIAIISLILYYAQIIVYEIPIFSGGFIGIDMFFVISGYLTTYKITAASAHKRNFSIISFFKNRIRRVIPPLLFVVIASFPFAYFYLLPNDLLIFVKSIISTISFNSNFFFHYSGNAFGDPNLFRKPFYHTWSISILIQYYIIFSLITFIAFKYFKKYFGMILSIIFISSFIITVINSENNQSLHFYAIQSRFWEFLAGSILCYYLRENKNKNKNKNLTFNLFSSVLGLSLIIYSVLFFEDTMPHPSFYTLIPIFGVLLIIWFSDKRNFITRLLSFKPLVFVGLISFSLYLWFYLIFSYYRIFTSSITIFKTSFYDKILICFIIIFFSLITYFFIEKKIQRNKIKFSKILKIISLKLIIIFLFCIGVILSNGYENRIPEEVKNKISYIDLLTAEYRDCYSKFNYKSEKACKIGNFNKDIFLTGDSRSGFLINSLVSKTNKINYNLNIYTGSKLDFRKNLNKFELGFNNYLRKELSEVKNSIIIINGLYNHPDYNFNFLDQYESFLAFFKILQRNNNQIIFIQPVPVIKNPYKFSGQNMKLINSIKKNKIFEYKIKKEEYHKTLADYFDFKKLILKYFKNITFLKTEDIFCDYNYCYSIKDGYFLLQDSEHQSALSADLISNLIIQLILNLEKKKY